MTEVLISLMHRFVGGTLDAHSFVDAYQAAWKKWRDAGQPTNLNRTTFDRVFTAADCYSPAPRTNVDITADQLRSEVSELLKQTRVERN